MPWNFLESIPELAALPAAWLSHLGARFPAFRQLCLQPSSHLATWVPCPKHCGCEHSVILRHDGTGAVAGCSCTPPICPDFPLTMEEITPLALDWNRFGRAICHAFNCQSKLATLAPPSTIQLGSWSTDAVPLILTIQTDRTLFRSVVAELAASLRKPFILLAPTATDLDATALALLHDAQAAFFPLEANIVLTPHGTLQPTRPPGELFAAFNPKPTAPAPDNVAIQSVALLKSLAGRHQFKKAHPLTVFMLYCAEGLSPAQIARQCHCTKGLVFIRLRWLRQKLGRHPAQLRQFATQLHSIADSLADPRAKHINPHLALYGDDPE